ncbi:glycosyltransferase [Cyanobium sp. FGCU-6]|nr:glycosyltransferase [Cyanobium sp. FGCU6]
MDITDAPRVRPHPWAVLLLTLLTLRYLGWRLSSTLNLSGPLATSLSLLALASELALIAHGLLLPWLSLALPRTGAGPQPPPEAAGAAFLPTLDILVPSYGEPREVVGRCLRACVALDHPAKTVWLLDDGGRPDLQDLAAELGCAYLARDQRLHAKAGNLNHALPHGRGELIAVIDADVVPLETFLQRTLPLFRDPAVGFVQTPQHAMNADPVMRNLRLERWLMPDEESFYRWVEPVRHALGAIVCAGTSFVVRRSALERVGGFETGTPSEDLATGIRITAAGYRNVYLEEKLSAGLAPLSASAMARQRCRWAAGTLQTLRTGASPLAIAGLKPLQRLAYLEGILHWLLVIPQLLLALLALAPGLVGVAPVLVRGDGLLTVALPYALVQLLLIRPFSGGSRNPVLHELYRWIFLVPLGLAVLATLAGRRAHFTVTPKALPSRRLDPSRRLLLPLLVLLVLQVQALLHLWPGLSPHLEAALSPLPPATLVLVLVWGLLQTLVLLLAIRCCFDRPGQDAAPWFACAQPVGLHGGAGSLPAVLTAVSARGAELRIEGSAAAAFAGVEATAPSALDGLVEDMRLPLRVETSRQGGQGALLLAVRWWELSGPQQEALEWVLYRRDGLWPRLSAPFEPMALLAVALRLARRVPPEAPFQRSLVPQHPLPGPRPALQPRR